MRGIFIAGGAVVSIACSGGGASMAETAPAAPASAVESAADVTAILSQMKERYRTAKTYRDEGTLVDVLSVGTADETVTRGQFKTRWTAADRLSFELRFDRDEFFRPKPLAICTSRPTSDTKIFFLNKVEDEPSLDDALNHLQGVSHGLTGLIPRWLADGGCRCSGQYTLVGTVSCGSGSTSATCYELTTTPKPDSHVKLYIDTKTSALRKYVSRYLIVPTALRYTAAGRPVPEKIPDPFEVEKTYEINPTFDGPIADTEFNIDTTPTPDD